MENTVTKPGFRKKFLGDKAFYKMVLAIAIPIMIQNGITNFVSLLDNIMIGRIGTEQMSGAAIVISSFLYTIFVCLEACPVLEFLQLSMRVRRIMKGYARHFATNYGW